LDERIRGFIEKAIDDLLMANFVSEVQWIRNEIPLKALEEVALGFAIGTFRTMISVIVASTSKPISEEDKEEIQKILRRRLPEIREKITKEFST